MPLKIFIGWAGKKGRLVAPILARWLKEFFEGVVEISTADLDLYPGQEISREIENLLDKAQAAIFCLSEDGLDSKWVHYEAASVAKASEGDKLITPYLIGISQEDQVFKDKWTGPLQDRKVAEAIREEDNRKMLEGINKRLKLQYPEETFNTEFDEKFPQLMNEIKQIIDDSGTNVSEEKFNDSGGIADQLTIWERKVLGIICSRGVREKNFLTDVVTIRTRMAKMGFSEGEFVLALINLQRGSYIEEERTGIPASYALTEKGLKWLNANFQDLIHDDR